MQITAIEVRGEAGHIVTMRRRDGSEFINCEVIKPDPAACVQIRCRADDLDELGNAATRLQREADGYVGTNSEAFEWLRVLEQLSDV